MKNITFKNTKLFISILTIFAIMFSFFANVSFADVEQEKELPIIQKLEVKDGNYLKKICKKNRNIRTTISELEDEGYKVNNQVAIVVYKNETSKVISYSSNDGKVLGMVQFIGDQQTSLRVFLKDDMKTVQKSVFVKSDGSEEILENINGELKGNNNSKISIRAMSPHLCNVFLSLAGGGISAIYAAAASAVLGPAAAVIITLIHTYGWTYVTDQCSK